MLLKFFKKINSQAQSVTSAAIIIGGLSVVSRLFGILRDRILAGTFGAGDELDIYYAAFRLPDTVYNLLILGSVSAGLIPVFTSLIAKHKKEEAWNLINNILNILSLILVTTCLLLFLLSPWLIPLITPGFAQEKLSIVVNMSQIMFLSSFFLGLSAIFSSILQSFRKFFLYSLAPIFYNLGIIIGVLYLTKPFGIYGLAWGVVLGALMHMTIQLLPIFSVGFRYQPILNFWDKNVIKVTLMTLPRTLSLAISQINFFIITIVASTLATGSFAIFNLSNNLQNFPLGVFGVSFGVAALPILSSLAAENKMKDFINTFSVTFRQTIFFILPASALLYVLRAQIVRVILGFGNFDWRDTRLTAACLAIFCLGLFAQSTYPLVIRTFYALHNTKTPFFVGLITLIVNFISLIFLVWLFSFDNFFSFLTIAILRLEDLWGVVDLRVLALPSAIVISSIFELMILLIILKIKIGKIDGIKIIQSSLRIIFASLGAGLFTYATLQLLDLLVITNKVWGIFTQGLVAGLIGCLGYLILSLLLQVEEMKIFIASIKRKLFKSAIIIAENNLGESEKN